MSDHFVSIRKNRLPHALRRSRRQPGDRRLRDRVLLLLLLADRIDTIKIDRSFITGLPDHADSVVIVNAIVSMAKSLGLKVVAEGVETQEQLSFLSTNHFEVGQGFLFRRPIPWRELERLLPKGSIGVETAAHTGPAQRAKVLRFGSH